MPVCGIAINYSINYIFVHNCNNVKTLINRRRARIIITVFSVTMVRDYGMPLIIPRDCG